MSDDEQDKTRRIAKALAENSKPAPSKRKRAPRATNAIGDVRIGGNGNIVANNVYQLTKPPTIRNVVTVDPDKTITNEQKAIIKGLVDDIVESEKAIKSNPVGHGFVWNTAKQKNGFTSYHMLRPDQFDGVKTYLQKWLASIHRSSSARRAGTATTRNKLIGSIQARCKEHPSLDLARRAYMLETFGATSMTQLTDDMIHSLYSYVFGLRRP